jgi:hypothetical protein
VATLERGSDDAAAVLALPDACRKRVFRIFPNRESAMRLLEALLMEQDEVWSTGKRYFDMPAYWQWHDPHATPGAQEGGSTPTA